MFPCVTLQLEIPSRFLNFLPFSILQYLNTLPPTSSTFFTFHPVHSMSVTNSPIGSANDPVSALFCSSNVTPDTSIMSHQELSIIFSIFPFHLLLGKHLWAFSHTIPSKRRVSQAYCYLINDPKCINLRNKIVLSQVWWLKCQSVLYSGSHEAKMQAGLH